MSADRLILSTEDQIMRMWRVLHMNTADIAREIRPQMSESDVVRVVEGVLDAEYDRRLGERRRSLLAADSAAALAPEA